MYKIRKPYYSQNFLRSPELVNKLIRQSSVGPHDLVLEIGPGKGIITRELCKVARKVIAVEKDEKLFSYLSNTFQKNQKLELIHKNILDYKLPSTPYKVFSNVPFNISADIVRKLTSDNNFLEGYLIVQKEFAKKLIGAPFDYKNQMVSVLLKPWFKLSVAHEFSRNDFVPKPSVDSIMIRVKRYKIPLVTNKDQVLYKSFIVSSYNQERISRLSFDNMLRLFNQFLNHSSRSEKDFVIKKAIEIENKQSNIQKIHRTRNDVYWRKY